MSRRLPMLVVAAWWAAAWQRSPPSTAQAAALSAVLVRTVDTGAWATPSPDPAGITYDAANNRLVLSDSEVDEMSLYQGRNVFFSTLDGQQTPGATGWTTVPWSVRTDRHQLPDGRSLPGVRRRPGQGVPRRHGSRRRLDAGGRRPVVVQHAPAQR